MNGAFVSDRFYGNFPIRGAWLMAMLLFSFSALAIGGDSLALRVGDRSIGRTEFTAAYRQHAATPDESAEEFARRYIDFLLTARIAEDEGVDTLPALRRELTAFRRELQRALHVCSPADESAAQALYARMKLRYGPYRVRVAEVCRHLPQRLPAGECQREEERMDSLARAIRSGAPFEACLSRYSDIREPYWVHRLQMPAEWEEPVFALAPGEVSGMFRTARGVHIVKLLERESIPPYEEVREELLRRVAGRDRAAESRPGTPSPLLPRITEERLRMRRDSCLVRLYSQQLSAQTAEDEAALQRLYEQDREKYRWPEARFRGIVLRCADKRTGKQFKRLLKSLPEAEWGNAVRLVLRQDSSLQATYTQGIFAPGDHPDVDEKIFKLHSLQHPSGSSLPSLPCVVCIGRKQKAPAGWQEVKEELAAELSHARLLHRTEERRRQTEVEINQEVLKTVNKH